MRKEIKEDAGKKILIVDDEEAIRDTLNTSLGLFAYNSWLTIVFTSWRCNGAALRPTPLRLVLRKKAG
jgi:DNA-binding NtrC family response regulator